MRRAATYIAFVGLAMGAAGMVYLLCLLAGISHIAVVAPLVLGAAASVVCLLPRHMAKEDATGRYYWLSLCVLAAGLVWLVTTSVPLMEKYGGWDAWSIWNLHAKFLAAPQYWRLMFDDVGLAHPDYPLLLPSLTAFVSRLCACRIETASFAINFGITVCIPAIIYLQFQQKNLLVAAAALFLLVTDKHYVARGISMYADTAVPFFLLCAVIFIRNPLPGNWSPMLASCALGCCACTKNEGIMLSALFVMVHYREMLSSGRLRYAVAGIALPLFVLLVFKLGFAPRNDMVHGVLSGTWRQLGDMSRYDLIWKSFIESVNRDFSGVKWAMALYFVVCLLKRQWPGKLMLFLVLGLLAYAISYVLTFQDLGWHLQTSFDRLLHQLMPVAVYAIVDRLSSVPAFVMAGKEQAHK